MLKISVVCNLYDFFDDIFQSYKPNGFVDWVSIFWSIGVLDEGHVAFVTCGEKNNYKNYL